MTLFSTSGLYAQTPIILPFSPDGKIWGAVNDKVEIIISPAYEEEFNFNDYFTASVKKNNKVGLIDTTGKLIVEPLYDKVLDLGNNLLELSLNNKFGYYSKKSKTIVLPIKYDELEINDKCIIAKVNNFYGIIDIKTNKPISKFEYDKVKNSRNITNAVAVLKNNKFAIFNTKFKKTVTRLE